MYMREPLDRNTELPVIGVFATLRDGDFVCRRLHQVGIEDAQIELIDLTRLIAEFSPDLAARTNLGTTMNRLSSRDDLMEKVSREIIGSSELQEYLYKAGIPEAMAPMYAARLRQGNVLVIARPDKEQWDQTENILYEANCVLNSSRSN
jgi:hypothetical protein